MAIRPLHPGPTAAQAARTPGHQTLSKALTNDPRVEALLVYLTRPANRAMPDFLVAGEQVAWQHHRPIHSRLFAPYQAVLPDSLRAINRQAYLGLLADPTVAVYLIEGSVYCFSGGPHIPEAVQASLAVLCNTDCAATVEAIDIVPGKKAKIGGRPNPCASFMRPVEPINWSTYVRERQERWAADPLPAVVNLSDYAWLAWHPELSDYLASQLCYLEPEDLEFLQCLLSSMFTQQGTGYTQSQRDSIHGMILGRLGEIAHRERIIAHYRGVLAKESRAVLILEDEIYSSQQRHASDALIGFIDKGSFTLLDAFELTASRANVAYTTAVQMQRTLGRRFPQHGLQILTRGGQGGRLTVTTDAVSAHIWVNQAAQAKALAALTDMVIETQLRLMALWGRVPDNYHRYMALTGPGESLLTQHLRTCEPAGPLTARQAEAAFFDLMSAHPEYRPYWQRVYPVMVNLYGLAGAVRQPFSTLGKAHGMGYEQVLAIEQALRTALEARGLIEVSIQDIHACREAVFPQLEAMLDRFTRRKSDGAPITTQTVQTTLSRMMSREPSVALYIQDLVAIFENMFIGPDEGRLSMKQLSKQLRVIGAGAGASVEDFFSRLGSVLNFEERSLSQRSAGAQIKKVLPAIWDALWERYRKDEPLGPDEARAALATIARDHPELRAYMRRLLFVFDNAYSSDSRVGSSTVQTRIGVPNANTVLTMEELLQAGLIPLEIHDRPMCHNLASYRAPKRLKLLWQHLARRHREGTEIRIDFLVRLIKRIGNEWPALGNYFNALADVAENLYSESEEGRLSATALAECYTGIDDQAIRRMEKLLRKQLGPLGMHVAPQGLLAAAREARAHIRRMIDQFAAEYDGGVSPDVQAVLSGLRTLCECDPELRLYYNLMSQIIENDYVLASRLSDDALGSINHVGPTTIRSLRNFIVPQLLRLGISNVG
jgi:hypothetical protein